MGGAVGAGSEMGWGHGGVMRGGAAIGVDWARISWEIGETYYPQSPITLSPRSWLPVTAT